MALRGKEAKDDNLQHLLKFVIEGGDGVRTRRNNRWEFSIWFLFKIYLFTADHVHNRQGS